MSELDAPRLDIRRILEALRRHQVEYVLIGGFASIIHGSPYPTNDADICPEPSAENLDRLAAALRELGARVRSSTEPDGLAFACDGPGLANAAIWNLVTPVGWFDISLQPSGTHGYDDLIRDATHVDIGDGVSACVASLADIVRSKEAADRPKDRAVLPVLRELLERGATPSGS